ncbi:hypothetical protein [Bradyrhizobium sp. SZCCHNR1015]|uniref:hypothetical protein n=1 Tax=Bradyrhizobium sp. SZCCHNR1015 TaxID=3057338 RepID=UPI002916B821|nr:hypothetical protein [Bradyrhizobium sp. SZCCHNR1015]
MRSPSRATKSTSDRILSLKFGVLPPVADGERRGIAARKAVSMRNFFWPCFDDMSQAGRGNGRPTLFSLDRRV